MDNQEKLYYVSSSSHIRDVITTTDIMRDVILAMIPAIVYSIYQFGLSVCILIIATVFSCVITEYIYQKKMKKPITIGDLSAVVTGMILALNMPPEIPVWIPMLGGVFAILVVKQVYGGIGCNWMNPALGARCFLLISFAGKMTDFTSHKMGYDAISGVTPLLAMKEYVMLEKVAVSGHHMIKPNYTFMELFLGNIPGSIGEVSALALLLGAAYLLIRKVITWRIPLTYILTVAIFSYIFGIQSVDYVIYQILGGGLIFGAFYMATDYSSSPITPRGQVIYAIIIGLFTGIFRLFGGSAEGVSYAILLGNILVPLIEKATLPIAFGKTNY